MKRVTPGVYADDTGALHLDLAEFLAAHRYADTPQNRRTVIEAARVVYGHVTITDAPLSYRCPVCGCVSFNPHDLEHRYCGRCHRFESL